MCIYDFGGRQSPSTATAGFVYIRLHGPDGPYQGNYTDEALKTWTEAVLGWLSTGKEVFCYFDNDQLGYAPQNAKSLSRMVGMRRQTAKK